MMTKRRLLRPVTITRASAFCFAIAAFALGAPVEGLAASAGKTWTGCYLGGNLGGAWAHKEYTDQTTPANQGSHNSSSVIGGGQFGCDYQLNNWVVGIQTQFDAADLHGSHIDPSTIIAPFTMQGKISWFGTVTGRIGYTWTRETLIYGKAGAAWMRGNDMRSGTIGGVFVTYTESDHTGIGWTLGFGVERMLAAHWSVFAEYDYVDVVNNVTWTRNTDGTKFPEDIKVPMHTLLAGFNYRF
jgi:outer membrane immunogenic protein